MPTLGRGARTAQRLRHLIEQPLERAGYMPQFSDAARISGGEERG
jgi:hypothetical protein